MKTVPLKLVPIITEPVLTEKLLTELKALGSMGFTLTEVTGEGSRHAANLFSALRKVDCLCLDHTVARPAPTHGLGLAINDRFPRAGR